MAAALGSAGLLAAAEANHRALIEHEVRRLVIAAEWADLHPGDAVDPDGLPGRERAVTVGGDGTPKVTDFCLADLAASLQMSAGSAARLIGDALDLRHLTLEQAGLDDARVAPSLGAMSWGRLHTGCKLRSTTPTRRARTRRRSMRPGNGSSGWAAPPSTDCGVIWAKETAGDALWGNALVARLAEILHREGDHDSLDVRRSKAFGSRMSGRCCCPGCGGCSETAARCC